MYLPDKSIKATRSTVIVHAPVDADGLFEPTTGRTVIPETVEMTIGWDYGTDNSTRVYASVWVRGQRLLKSGDLSRRITVSGWEVPVVEGRHGVQYRPQWLTDLIAAHLPAVLDLEGDTR